MLLVTLYTCTVVKFPELQLKCCGCTLMRQCINTCISIVILGTCTLQNRKVPKFYMVNQKICTVVKAKTKKQEITTVYFGHIYCAMRH